MEEASCRFLQFAHLECGDMSDMSPLSIGSNTSRPARAQSCLRTPRLSVRLLPLCDVVTAQRRIHTLLAFCLNRDLMSLVADYKHQFVWRAWPSILEQLLSLQGKTVLDLGCAVGDQAAEFVARGAYVIGVDAEFRSCDLRTVPDLGVLADGLWCSFTAAYFPDLSAVLTSWGRHLRSGGWVALTEIDDLFGHEPLSGRARSLPQGYAADALAAGRYDFHMGRKLRDHLERAGAVDAPGGCQPIRPTGAHRLQTPSKRNRAANRDWAPSRPLQERCSILLSFLANERFSNG